MNSNPISSAPQDGTGSEHGHGSGTTPEKGSAQAPGQGDGGGSGLFTWFHELGASGRRAFAGAFGGYALDSYDYFTLPLSMVAHRRRTSASTAARPACSPPSRWSSPRSAAPLAGVLADRIGRVQGADDHGGHVRGVHRGRAASRPTTRRCWSSAPSRGSASAVSGRSARSWSPSTPAPSTAAARSASIQSSWAVGWALAVDRLHAGLPVPRRRHGLARDVLDRRAARAARPLGAAQGPGRARRRPRSARSSADKGSFAAIFKRGPAAHDALRGAALHRRPGRLLHARHLGAHAI